jgi:hypothetical protein
MVKPKNTLVTLKDKRKDNVIVVKQVYNARQKYKKSISDEVHKCNICWNVWMIASMCTKFRTVGESATV